MKKLSFFILIFLSIASIFIVANDAKALEENVNDREKAVYFYQETCDHCQAVDKYFRENGIYDNYDIRKIEISGAYNLGMLNEFFDAFEISSQKRGWPAIFFGRQFLVGDNPIIKNFATEIERTDATEFPNPESIKKYMANEDAFSKEESSYVYISPVILLGAALADSVSPGILVIFIILTSIIVFRDLKNKKEIIIFESFFFLSIFLVYFSLGVEMFGFGKILKLSKSITILLGLSVIISGIIILKKYWRDTKIAQRTRSTLDRFITHNFKSRAGEKWKSAGDFFQKINLITLAVLSGFISSVFLFPCAAQPYGIFTNSFPKERGIFVNVMSIILYDLIFILPIVLMSVIVCWFVHTKKLEIFRIKHGRLIRIVVSISLFFVGSYFIYSNGF